MALDLYNTLSGTVEEFRPLEDNEVRMYSCGPTVYDYGHIGNFRTFIAVDILRRFLRQSGYKIRHVMNITDVDDKIIRNSAAAGVSVKQYTAKYEKAFLEDAAALNIEHPILARATDHIPEMAEFIAALQEKGFAYRTEDGSYYFSIAKFPDYGKLSKKDFAGMEDGARVDVDEYEKDSARDFALWKAPKPGETSWDTPIGPGRPGWHIECSVMAMEELGETFDLHAGGEDLIFPIMKMKSRSPNRSAESPSLTFGFMYGSCWSRARRCPKAREIFLRCVIWCLKGTSRRRSGFCWLRFPTAISLISPSTGLSRRPCPSSGCETSNCAYRPDNFPTAKPLR